MHSEATFVYAVTEAAYFTSHLSLSLVSVMHSLPLSSLFPVPFFLCLPCHQTVMLSIPLCLFTYLPLSVSGFFLLPLPLLFVLVTLLRCLSGGERGIAHCCIGKDRDRGRERGACERGEEDKTPEGRTREMRERE